MTEMVKITAELSSETVSLVESLALARGLSGAQYVAEAVRRAAESDADYRSFVRAGIESANRGELVNQEDMEAWFEERVAARAHR